MHVARPQSQSELEIGSIDLLWQVSQIVDGDTVALNALDSVHWYLELLLSVTFDGAQRYGLLLVVVIVNLHLRSVVEEGIATDQETRTFSLVDFSATHGTDLCMHSSDVANVILERVRDALVLHFGLVLVTVEDSLCHVVLDD